MASNASVVLSFDLLADGSYVATPVASAANGGDPSSSSSSSSSSSAAAASAAAASAALKRKRADGLDYAALSLEACPSEGYPWEEDAVKYADTNPCYGGEWQYLEGRAQLSAIVTATLASRGAWSVTALTRSVAAARFAVGLLRQYGACPVFRRHVVGGPRD